MYVLDKDEDFSFNVNEKSIQLFLEEHNHGILNYLSHSCMIIDVL